MKAMVSISIFLSYLVSLVVVFASPFDSNEIVKLTPQSWFWGDLEGESYLTKLQTERAPRYCRSSWAVSTAGALSDRVKIHYPEIQPAVSISTQVLLNCAAAEGCKGGDPVEALKYIEQNGIPDETCQNYEGKENSCTDFNICRDCTHGRIRSGEDFLVSHCRARYDYPAYGLEDYGVLKKRDNASMVDAMMVEIHTQGTITCAIRPSAEFQDYKGGVLDDESSASNDTHYINVVGWDATAEPKYWIVRNCWGEIWGIGGYAKIKMGINALGIEDLCYWGRPKPLPSSKAKKRDTIRHTIPPSTLKVTNPALLPPYGRTLPPWRRSRPEIEVARIPKTYDIRNIDGRSYAMMDRNQHIPVYCGSCAYIATLSSLNDRLALTYNNTSPLFEVSPQALINCFSWGCRGTFSDMLFPFLPHRKIPHDSCAPYEAIDKPCTPINNCQSCTGDGQCEAVPEDAHWDFEIEDCGYILGEEDMKLEILTAGPIVCIVSVPHDFYIYAGGLYNDTTGKVKKRHSVEVAGWGEEEGVPYWIVRNSWGRYWGENGWARIAIGPGDLGLSRQECGWVKPKPFDRPLPHKTLLRSSNTHSIVVS